MVYEDPYAVLGLSKGASKKDVQQAFRDLARRYHPDKVGDSSKEAAERFQRISRAATVILKEGSLSPRYSASSSGAAARQAWQEQNQASTSQWVKNTRSTRLPAIFIAACLVGGCALFAGAVHVHQDLYSYNVAANADERRDNPTPAQQKINELLYEKRLQKQFEKP